MTKKKQSKSTQYKTAAGKPTLVNGVVVLQHQEEEDLEQIDNSSTELQFTKKDGGVYASVVASEEELFEEQMESSAEIQTKEGIISVSNGGTEIQHITSPATEAFSKKQVEELKYENDQRADKASITAPPKVKNGVVMAASNSYADIEDLIDVEFKEEEKETQAKPRKVNIQNNSTEQSDLDYLVGTPVRDES